MRDLSATERRERALGELAGRQYGRVSTAQLHALGFDRHAISRRARAGRLHRLHRGAYAVGHVVPSPLGNRMAAVLAVPDSALGRRSAGAHLGARPYAGTPELVVMGTNGRTRRSGLIVLRVTHLSPADLTVVDGIPVTTFARTALDLATVLPQQQDVKRLITRGEQLGLFDLRALHAAIARAPRHRGIKPLTAALAALHPDAVLNDSDLEAAMAELTDAHGLPRASFQFPLLGHQVDFHWPEAGLVAQTDGFEFHRSRQAFQEDRAQDRALQLAGFRVLRFTWDDLTLRPDTVAEQLSQALTLPTPRRAPRASR